MADLEDVVPVVGGTNYGRVSHVIRRDILRGIFRPGERLKAVELALRYNVSPVPIREALQQLSGEGLVIMLPNRGARVRSVDSKFVRDVYQLREVVAGDLTAKGVARITDEVVERMKLLNDLYLTALSEHDLHFAAGANRLFHDSVMSLADNYVASMVLYNHASVLQMLRLQLGYSQKRLNDSRQEHADFLEACRRRDATAAAEISRLHTRGALQDILERMVIEDDDLQQASLTRLI